jgi:O-methyltransferase involved in polyketide biosynthesis
MSTSRNYDSISPSAKVLLMTKAMTTIPFAKEAADMVWGADQLRELWSQHANAESFIWLLHFENRYRTIDVLMQDAGTTNFLEVSSGFSFRGLDLCREKEVVYIDTDLPASMENKRPVVQQLITQYNISLKGKLLMEALNALDEQAFNDLVDQFPPGAVTILNEGLLMYLEEPEKRRLCAIIHAILSKRGGSWITGDIYIKKTKDEPERSYPTEQAKNFLTAHRVEEKKFDSFEEAATFFESCGFSIVQKEVVAYEQLSALRFIQDRNIPADTVKGWFRNRETWKLVPVI